MGPHRSLTASWGWWAGRQWGRAGRSQPSVVGAGVTVHQRAWGRNASIVDSVREAGPLKLKPVHTRRPLCMFMLLFPPLVTMPVCCDVSPLLYLCAVLDIRLLGVVCKSRVQSEAVVIL